MKVGNTLKYLGLTLDHRWRFEAHFYKITPKVDKAAIALGRLLPNLKRPDGSVRRLYTWVMLAIMLYGAPIWAESIQSNGKIKRLAEKNERTQRKLALRLIRAYRTVSGNASLMLAGTLPFLDG